METQRTTHRLTFIIGGYLTFIVVWSLARWLVLGLIDFLSMSSMGMVTASHGVDVARNVLDWAAYWPLRLPYALLQQVDTVLTRDQAHVISTVFLVIVALAFVAVVLSLLWGCIRWIFGLFIPHYLIDKPDTKRIPRVAYPSRKSYSLF